MRSIRVIVLDAFTQKPFAGNPCAVIPDARGLSDRQLMDIARETNLPETAFVFPSDQADFRVRYFTPRSEVNFAGHPTIATSFMLALEGMIALQEPVTTIQLEFNIGVLPVDIQVKDGKPVQAIMTQPAPVFKGEVPHHDVAACLGLSVTDLREDCTPQVVSTGVPFMIVAVKDVETLGKVKMDRDRLYALLQPAGANAAFAFSLGGYSPLADTHARFFDPKGTFEDPYTGSAAGCMGAYVVNCGLKKGPTLRAEQGHFVNRPGEGNLEIIGEPGKITGVRLGGPAVKVMEGSLFLD